MVTAQSKLVVLFADIGGSTALYERLGDVKARKQVAACLSTVTGHVKRSGGEVIKTIGDEVMCTFADAEAAVNAAIGMQKALAGNDQGKTGRRIRLAIRVGLHFGPVIQEAGDVFGDTVNISARMTALAKEGQIITTQNTVRRLPPALSASSRLLDYTPVKGKREEIAIFEVIWQHEDVTSLATSVLAAPPPSIQLVLRHRDQEIRLDHDHPSVSLGRSKPCEIIVNSERASRQHAHVEYRRGKFFIIDKSTNGTYVRVGNEEQVFLRREQMLLKGQGMISLGIAIEKTPTEIVHFACGHSGQETEGDG